MLTVANISFHMSKTKLSFRHTQQSPMSGVSLSFFVLCSEKTSKEKILEREIKEIKQELDIKQERESDDDCGPSPSKRRKKIGNSVSPCFCYCCCRLWFMGFTPSHLNQFEILCIAGNRRYRYNGF